MLAISKVLSGERPDRPDEAQQLGLVDQLWYMVERCWQHDPDRRPVMATVVGSLREWSFISPHVTNLLTYFLQLCDTPCRYTCICASSTGAIRKCGG